VKAELDGKEIGLKMTALNLNLKILKYNTNWLIDQLCITK